MVLAIFNSPLISKYDISSLKRIMCGAAPLPADVADQVQKRLKVQIFQGMICILLKKNFKDFTNAFR